MKAFDRYGRLLTTDQGYEHEQTIPARVWVIDHELGYQPAAVSIWIDGILSEAHVQYVDDDRLTITFNSSVSGRCEVK